MPRLLSSLAVVGIVTPTVLAVPVATPGAGPRAVKPSVAHVALAAVPAPVGATQGPAVRRAALAVGQTSTRAFTTVGVTWQHDPAVGEVRAEVRWRRGGRWSTWYALAGDSADAPDARSVDAGPALRDGTAPVWVGWSNGVQARVTTASGVAPRDVRVDLVDPGTSPADASVGRAPRDTAAAVEGQPAILSRADWGADESLRRESPEYTSTVKVGFVHHTATANAYSEAETAAMIRSIYAYHVKSNGWSDIGYNFLVDRFGRIWEGRYGGISRAVLGAHTGGFNSESFGASLLGTYSTVVPPAATLTALEKLFAWKLGSYYRDPTGTASLRSAGGSTARYPAGTTNAFSVVSGHRDAGYTTCPGDATYARMGSIRTAISNYLGTAFVDPTISATRLPAGSTTPVTVRAAAVRNAASWTVEVTTPAGATVRSWSGTAGEPVTATWDLTDAGGATVPVGAYVVRLTASSSGGDTALPWSATVVIGQPQVGKGAWLSPERFSTRFSAPAPSPS